MTKLPYLRRVDAAGGRQMAPRLVVVAVRPAGFCYWRPTFIVSTDETVEVPAAVAAGTRSRWVVGHVVCRTSNDLYGDSGTEPLFDGALPAWPLLLS